MNLIILLNILFLCICAPSAADTEVSCLFMESCILPCSFLGGDEIIIHWFHLVEDVRVHAFYQNQDQLGHQDQRFRGRTSLFKDQISRRNASLLLSRVKVQDQGEYRCLTSTTTGNKESFINLKVDAPVSEVNITQLGNTMTCSSEGIYPEPELTWSTIPPSSRTLQSRTTVHQTEDQLYSINSSLVVSDGGSDRIYSCTIRTERNWRKVTVRREATSSVSSSEATISCSASNISLTNLVWRFNLSQIIVKQTGTNVTVSEEWRKHVKEVSESGSLTLQDLSSQHQGTYTCEVSDGEETIKTNVFLKINQAEAVVIVTIAVFGVLLVLLTAAVAVIILRKRR